MTAEEIQALKNRAVAADKRADEATARASAAEGKAEQLASENAKLLATRSDVDAVAAKDVDIAALKLRLDTVEGELKTASDPKRFRDAVLKRVDVETKARAILGDRFRGDMSDRELMLAVLQKTGNDTVASGSITDKDDSYVAARFDTAVAGFAATEREYNKMIVAKAAKIENRNDSRSEREKAIARMRGEKVD